MEQIKKRLKQQALTGEVPDIQEALGRLQKDGKFAGVEYYKTDRLQWTANLHLAYLRDMVKAVYMEKSPYYQDPAVIEKTALAGQFWADGGRVPCDNWWWEEIGLVHMALEILSIDPPCLEERVTERLYQEACRGDLLADPVPEGIRERTVGSTGANLTDKLISACMLAVWKEDEKRLDRLHRILENELRFFEQVYPCSQFSEIEGVKPDYSFHQHGDLIQFGGYGEAFVFGITEYIRLFEGTPWALSRRALSFFGEFLRNGISWGRYRDRKDYLVGGRTYTRPGGTTISADYVKAAAELLLGLEIDGKAELEAFYRTRYEGEDTLRGNRYYWLSDYMSHFGAGCHIGVKLSSRRTKAGELINGEDLLGYYRSDGAMSLLADGREYDEIFTVWDYNKIPGTTTPKGGLRALEAGKDWWGEDLYNWRGESDFAGGVSDGLDGACTQIYDRDGLRAKKAWFLLGNAAVCLGCGIEARHPEVYTCINQCLRRGPVLTSGGEALLQSGTYQTEPGWIYHDQTGYILTSPAALSLETREAHRSRINLSYHEEEPVKQEVFTLGYDHGTGPEKESYEYTVLMNTTKEKTAQYARHPEIHTVCNGERIQCVYEQSTGTVGLIAYKCGGVTLPNGVAIAVNRPCELLIRFRDTEAVRIAAANPRGTGAEVTLEIGARESVVLSLPDGAAAGKSVMMIKEKGVWKRENEPV